MPEIILLSSPLSPAKAHHLGQVVKSLVWTFFFPFFVKTKSLYYYTSTYVAIEMGSKCGRGVALCILIHIAVDISWTILPIHQTAWLSTINIELNRNIVLRIGTLCCISLGRCCLGLETRVIIKISTYPCCPINVD